MRQSASSNPRAMKRIARISLPRPARGMITRGLSSMCVVVVAIKNSNCKPKDLRGFPSEQVGLDEVVDVAAEHCLDVTSFQFSASVFYQLIGGEYITSDLRPEGDVCFIGFEFGGFSAPPFQLEFIKTRAQHLHGNCSILML